MEYDYQKAISFIRSRISALSKEYTRNNQYLRLFQMMYTWRVFTLDEMVDKCQEIKDIFQAPYTSETFVSQPLDEIGALHVIQYVLHKIEEIGQSNPDRAKRIVFQIIHNIPEGKVFQETFTAYRQL